MHKTFVSAILSLNHLFSYISLLKYKGKESTYNTTTPFADLKLDTIRLNKKLSKQGIIKYR